MGYRSLGRTLLLLLPAAAAALQAAHLRPRPHAAVGSVAVVERLSPGCADCVADFHAAVARCAAAQPRPCTVLFAPGSYPWRLPAAPAEDASGAVVRGARALRIEGLGATLVVNSDNGFHGALRFIDCVNLTVSGLTLDMDQPPYVLGQVVQRVNASAFKLRYDPGDYPAREESPRPWHRFWHALTQWDPAGGHFTAGIDAYSYGLPVSPVPGEADTLLVSQITPVPRNDTWLVLRHMVGGGSGCNSVGGCFGIELYRCANVTVQRVHWATGVSFALYVHYSHTISLLNNRVVPREGRPMSVTADASHLVMTTGTVDVKGGEYAGMGDDGINLHNMWVEALAAGAQPAQLRLNARACKRG